MSFLFKPTYSLPTTANIEAHTVLTVKTINKVYKKAEDGDANAQAELATGYITGSIGNIPNYSRAIYWLDKSIKKNNGLAYYTLYLIYNRGLSVPQNSAKAIDYAKKAIPLMKKYIKAHSKAANALHYWRLGQAYFWGIGEKTEVKGKTINTWIAKRNLQTSFNYFHKAAEVGDFRSIMSIIYMYQHGLGTKENPKEAFRWAKYLASLHFPLAYYITALDYLHGNGVKENRAEAIKLLNEDVEADYYPALKALTKLAKSGDKTALTMIKDQSLIMSFSKLNSQLAMDPYFNNSRAPL
ncbi:sel1 repeat family protein [Francisellaceae bacterium]|nr:sel1 repeat family protein [Francisellaceae bacterium]